MTKKHTLSDLEQLIDGECTAERAEQIKADADNNMELADQLKELQQLNRLIRTHAAETEAPASLRRAIAERFDAENGDDHETMEASPAGGNFLKRRSFITGAGGLLAASAAALAIAPDLNILRSTTVDPVGTFFHDFETYLLKDKAIDVKETNMVRLAEWFSDRLPFSLPPIGSSGAGAQLLGGRLCWLLERRLAALTYEANDGPIIIYVMEADGLNIAANRGKSNLGTDLSWHRSSGNTSLIWKSGGLLMVMVGTQELRRLMSIAETLIV